MTKGQLPKAYLRLDPNADQHPDPAGLLLLTCSANRQHPRGRFLRQTVLALLGRKRAAEWTVPRPGRVRADLVEQPDGTLYLDGWDEMQEGDWTVSERMQRLRHNRNSAVTTTVTGPSLVRSPDRHPPSEASGVKASGTEKRRKNERPVDPPSARDEEPPPTTATPAEAKAKALAVLGAVVAGPSPCAHPAIVGRPIKPGKSLVCADCGVEFRGATGDYSGPKPNPFVQADGRAKWELEAMRLTREISQHREERVAIGHVLGPDEPVDGSEIFVLAAKYDGAAPGRQKCNPASLTDDRLLNTVLDLRATLKAEQEKRAKGAA